LTRKGPSALTLTLLASISRHTRARASRGLFGFHAINRSLPELSTQAGLAASDIKERGQAMANTVSAKKMTRKIAKRTEINRSRRSRMRTYIRKVEEAIASGNQTEAVAALRAAEPEMMRAAQKGIVHKNTASRKVSRLASRIKTLSA
jgi:small subunit ribosomal protein S20